MSPHISSWATALRAPFLNPVDDRIYALVRISFAIVSLINLARLWPDREMLLSPDGMIGRAATFADGTSQALSVFSLLTSPGALSAYLIFHALCLLSLMLGIAPRAVALAVFIWHLSFRASASPALTGWDEVLSAFSFLILISPLGRTWSLPTIRTRHAHTAHTAHTAPCYGLTLMRLQVLVIYWQTVVLKLAHPAPFWRDGDFLSYYLLSHFSRWPGTWVLDWSALLGLLTWLVLLVEIAIPPLLFIRRTRFIGLALGLSLHLGITLFSRDLEMFLLVMAMSYLAFLRDEDVAALQRFTLAHTRPRIPAPPKDRHS
jgi:hypothetical protein